MINKSFITNLIASIIAICGYILDQNSLFMIGLFALSGSLTNSLAIYMLFEKIPFLYGSGVIEAKFETFKSSIHSLIMEQFFNQENLKKFFENEFANKQSRYDFTTIIENTDFTMAFDSLKSAVMESSFGGMLGMFGGEKALDPLKEPFTKKIKSSINSIVHTDSFQQSLQKSFAKDDIQRDILRTIDNIVKKRIDELTPQIVKQIIQELIKEHLGWLVIWGAVFGGLIGLVSSFLV